MVLILPCQWTSETQCIILNVGVLILVNNKQHECGMCLLN